MEALPADHREMIIMWALAKLDVAGCGAVRKDIFLASGGFDAVSYPYPSIEDIELGFRLRQRGLRILLAPEVQGTHLKIWRLANLLHTDIFRRALPWTRLIHAKSGLPNALNVGVGERVNAALAAGLLLAIALAAAMLVPLWVPLAVIAAVAVANRRLFDAFRRARGTLFAVAGVAFISSTICTAPPASRGADWSARADICAICCSARDGAHGEASATIE